MKVHKERIGKVLQILNQELRSLGHFYVLVEKSLEAMERGGESDLLAIEGIYEASWRALLIGLTGMMSNDQESVTIAYLLDLAANHPYDFEGSSPEQIKEAVRQARSRLGSMDDLEVRLRELRDRRLAHLDRKLVNESAFFDDIDFSTEDCSEILQVIEDEVGFFYEAFYGEWPEFPEHRSALTRSLERLFPRRMEAQDEQG